MALVGDARWLVAVWGGGGLGVSPSACASAKRPCIWAACRARDTSVAELEALAIYMVRALHCMPGAVSCWPCTTQAVAGARALVLAWRGLLVS